MDKTGRNGLRVGDIEAADFKERYNRLKEKHLQLLGNFNFDTHQLGALEKEWMSAIKEMQNLVLIDSEHYINACMKNGQAVLAEGAQGSLLDIDFGSYPFVTSSNTITAGACTGLGIAPNKIGEVIGIFKAYCTRVGSGPFPSELFDEVGERLARIGNEFGSTTGRARRCGWIDLPALKYAININGVTQLNMMKADVLSGLESIKVCTHYMLDGEKIDYLPFEDNENLTPVYTELKGWEKDIMQISSLEEAPQEVHDYISYLEKELETPITLVSVGPDRTQTFFR
jgi:adenylosuccinate synthase